MGQRENDWLFYIKELKSEECQCGRPKKSGRSFCYTCFKRLPYHMQQDLYQHVGSGYEEAYDAAVEWLSD